MSDYLDFLRSKECRAPLRGLDDVPTLAAHLFPYQRACVEFLLRVGSGGLFLDTGLGKTACELEWASHAAEATNGRALILTPLAVARQIEAEGKRWGYDVRVVRDQSGVRSGLNVCNYDRLDRLDASRFGAVALDESSILKSFTGKTTRALINAFSSHRFRLSATATPAPNDHMELGQHAEFCGVMPSNEMLMRWFVTDQTEMGRYRLKTHGVGSFWDWMASWCRMASLPSDLGDSDEGFILPSLSVRRRTAKDELRSTNIGDLFGAVTVSATGMHTVKRATARARAEIASEIVRSEPSECWVVWVDTDYEADEVTKALEGVPRVAEVRGSFPIERKEDTLTGFLDGTVRVLITKPSVTGFGLNWQHCARTIFVGRSFSYEAWYQAIRRLWRFGQRRSVQCHLIVASGEESIGRVIDRKASEHESMKQSMTAAMQRAMSHSAAVRVPYNPKHEGRLPAWFAV